MKGINNKEYLSRWPERLGIAKNTPSREKNLIWIHAVSVGEVNASIPLLRRLKEEYEDLVNFYEIFKSENDNNLKQELNNLLKSVIKPPNITNLIKELDFRIIKLFIIDSKNNEEYC